MFKVNKRSSRCHTGDFFVNFEYILHVALAYFFADFEGINLKILENDVFIKLGSSKVISPIQHNWGSINNLQRLEICNLF